MDPQVLNELETASRILLASPKYETNERRRAAEAVFLNFRNTKNPYVLCKKILETSQEDYVLFESAGLIKTALIKEWRFLPDEEKTSLRDYLLEYVNNKPTLPAFVREKILQVLSIMLKRESVEDSGVSLSNILPQVEHLIFTGDGPRQTLGCCLLAAILQEFALTQKSSDVGLTWENHLKAKIRFQDVELKRIFEFCCRALNEIMTSSNESSPPLLKHLLSLAETVLTWKFVKKSLSIRLCGLFDASEAEDGGSLRPTGAWRDLLLNPDIVSFFFTVYWQIRMNAQVAHHGMTCLVQLASLSSCFNSKNDRMDYVTNYLRNFISLINSIEVFDREALGVSNIVTKLLNYNLMCVMEDLPTDLVQSFVELFTNLTCAFATKAAAEESLSRDDRLFMEGLDRLMESWCPLFSEGKELPPGLKQTVANPIFNVYVKLHVAPPDGLRGDGRLLEEEEVDEISEPDRITFLSQLHTVGLMGIAIPEHSLVLLSRLLEDRVRKLGSLLQKLSQQQFSISESSATVLLFEDIHWLLLIAGNTISTEGEWASGSTVPMDLMRYSIKQAAPVDRSVQVFGSPHQDIEVTANASSDMDHVLRLVSATFRLAHILRQSMEAKLVELLSPEVSSSLLWFLQRWTKAYLLLDEELYADLSPALIAAHGRDSDGGIWAARFLLDQVVCHLVHFHAEPTVVHDAVSLLATLVQGHDKRCALFKSDGIGELIKIVDSLPTYVKRGVYRALTEAGIAVDVKAVGDETYWGRFLQPLQDRFNAIVNQEDMRRNYQNENVRTELMDILECLTGVVTGTSSSLTDKLFTWLGPILAQLPALLGVYRNYQAIVEAIMLLHCQVAALYISFLSRTLVNKFYQICLQLIETYARWNSGRLSLESDSHDDNFQDIFLLLDLLTHLLSKDMLDLAFEANENEPIVTASDVCLSGLNLIMPLMNVGLLLFPALCMKYYKLLYFLSDMFPEKILELPEPLLKSVLHSIELGCTSFGSDIVVPCVDFLQVLGGQIIKMSSAAGSSANPVLRPFLKLLLELVLTKQLKMDAVPNISVGLYVLMCCYQQDYQELVREILSSQSEPGFAERLAHAFHDLTSGMEFQPTRLNKRKFSAKFEKFSSEINAFLFVK